MKFLLILSLFIVSIQVSTSQVKTRLDSIWGKGKCISGNCQNGNGEYYIPRMRATYKGQFKDGLFHGKGKMTFEKPIGSDGKPFDMGFYDGEWERGEKNGYGVQDYGGDPTFSRKTYYGYWKNGARNGWGKIVFVEGDTWEGNFVNSEMVGWFIIYQMGLDHTRGTTTGWHHYKILYGKNKKGYPNSILKEIQLD